MKQIELTQGKYALVDDEDFDYLSQWRWFFDGNYAANKSPNKIYMHRLINKTPEGCITDHINRNKLDNCKENLRTVNGSQNMLNITPRSDNKSGETGVFWRKDRNKWSVYISFEGKRTYLGHHDTKEEAISARKRIHEQYA